MESWYNVVELYREVTIGVTPGTVLPPPEMFNRAVNDVQPALVPAFTAAGFKVVRTPPELQASPG